MSDKQAKQEIRRKAKTMALKSVSAPTVRAAVAQDVPQNVDPTKKVKPKARAEDFALLLADDAEKNFDKMIPVTPDMLSEAMAFLDEVVHEAARSWVLPPIV
jgi:hypothetical protein